MNEFYYKIVVDGKQAGVVCSKVYQGEENRISEKEYLAVIFPSWEGVEKNNNNEGQTN